MIEDDLYIPKIVNGDETAFRYFVDSHSKDLFYFAMGYVHVREAAEEVVSDVFLEMWNNRKHLNEIRHIQSWLLVITRNKSISYLRKEGEGTVISFEDIEEYHLPYVQSPDHKMISQEEIDRVNRAIAILPPKCKEVFMLAKIQGLPYKEIAEILGISVKTINIHIAKAINLVAEILRK